MSDIPAASALNSITYRDAGVDIDAGEALVDRIEPHVKRSIRPEVMGGLGGFGAMFELPLDRYRKPVLVSGTDGVGTKLRLAIETGRHDTIGIDLVGMCVNDVVVQGAEPLFFLDYYATGKLNVDVAESVIKGIVEGCVQAGCALVGGETAEMPGMYAAGDYDLAGFCVGVVEKDKIIDGSKSHAGDVLIALPSSGPHSNGYSLIRKLLEHSKATPETRLDTELSGTGLLYDALLTPTRIYVKSILALMQQVSVHSVAHITGGGLLDNIPRVVPDGLEVVLQRKSWTFPAVFQWLQRAGNISATEMLRTFNCGIGMTICVSADNADQTLGVLKSLGESPIIIGELRHGNGGVVVDG